MPTGFTPIRLCTGKREMTLDCPQCGNSVTSFECCVTLVGYRSPEGHNHDDNCRTFHFLCPDRHQFTCRPQNTCPNPDCDWMGKETCWCHPDGYISKVGNV